MKTKEPISRAAVILCALVIIVTGLLKIYALKEDSIMRPHIKAVIDMGKYDPHSQKLLAGYNYYLLKHISDDTPTRIDIDLDYNNRQECMDSLLNGSTDILVLPFGEDMPIDSTLIQIPVDSAGLWILTPDMSVEAKVIEDWIEDFQKSESYEAKRKPFFSLYDPYKKASADFISPYDSIIKIYADTLGWDWKLLAAVVYQESNFRIEAHSHRGAKGLMQMVPRTARHFKVDDLIDPEQSIRAGALYLKKLADRYSSIPKGEREKFVLAAYNAGEGRIKDCLNYARFKGVDDKHWDSIVGLIPEMNDSTIVQVDTVKLGIFKGRETISYVNSVMNLWDEYKRICK